MNRANVFPFSLSFLRYDRSADIFSLGVILIEMATGATPSRLNLLPENIYHSPPAPPAAFMAWNQLRPHIRPFLLSLIALDRQARPPAASLLQMNELQQEFHRQKQETKEREEKEASERRRCMIPEILHVSFSPTLPFSNPSSSHSSISSSAIHSSPSLRPLVISNCPRLKFMSTSVLSAVYWLPHRHCLKLLNSSTFPTPQTFS
jgi:serine/threonine protein kinase